MKEKIVVGRRLTYEEVIERKIVNGLIEAVSLNSRIECGRDDELLFPEVRALRGMANGMALDLGDGYEAYVLVAVQRKVEGR